MHERPYKRNLLLFCPNENIFTSERFELYLYLMRVIKPTLKAVVSR